MIPIPKTIIPVLYALMYQLVTSKALCCVVCWSVASQLSGEGSACSLTPRVLCIASCIVYLLNSVPNHLLRHQVKIIVEAYFLNYCILYFAVINY